jgi:hypothetical protein
MQSLNSLFILTLVLIITISLYSYYNKLHSDIAIVKSNIDNKEYLVRKVLPSCPYTATQAADILAILSQKCTEFIKTLNNKYMNEDKQKSKDNENIENKMFIERLTKNFHPNSLSESSSYHKGTSYSLNKGEKIVLCLRQKDDNSFVDMNTLMFVFLHELAHLGTVENKTHSPIFDRNFKFILKEAIDHNLYSYHDYNTQPVIYCGKPITQNPLSL